jgi:O-antigen ligase
MLNPALPGAIERPRRDAVQSLAVVVCALLVALPWFWPILVPPRPEFWPDMLSWAAGAVLLSLLLWTRDRADESIATGWLLAALGSSVLALMQYLDLENRFYPWIVPTQPGHALANVHQTNMLASLLAVGLLTLWWVGRRQLLRPVHQGWMAALMIAALAATASRTGMLHLLTLAALLFFWHRRAWRTVLAVVLAAGAFYLLAAWGLQALGSLLSGAEVQRDIASRFGATEHCHSRLVLWSNVLDLIALKPWTGWGPGGLLYAHYITLFDDLRYCAKLSNAHNLPLQMAVTLGVPLTVLLVAGFIWFIARLKPWAATDATERWLWGVWLLLGLHSLLEFPLWFGVFQLMAGLAVRQLIVARQMRLNPRSSLLAFLSSARAMGVVSVLALACLAAVTWDYVKVSQLYLPDSRRLERYRVDTFEKARTAWLYDAHVLIPQVVVTPLTPQNAGLILQGALESLHVAPDARVIRRVIEAAEMAGQPELAEFHRLRFQAAWPREYAKWQALRAPQSGRSSPPASPASAPR